MAKMTRPKTAFATMSATVYPTCTAVVAAPPGNPIVGKTIERPRPDGQPASGIDEVAHVLGLRVDRAAQPHNEELVHDPQ
jgi:hypothetical protein